MRAGAWESRRPTKRGFIGIVAALALANEATAQLAVDFVPTKPCSVNGGAVPLDRLDDETICELSWAVTGRPFSDKLVSVGNWNALFGDDDGDGDGDFFEHAMGEMDALALHPKNEPDVDALVAMIGLDGGLTTTIGGLQSLDVDPAGGLFVGVGGVLWPNLNFGGSDIGARVLTTGSNVGAIAWLNGLPLGDVPAPTGFWLGLDGLGSDAGSMCVIPDREDPLCVDLEGEGLSNVDPIDMPWVGNGTPLGTALLIAKLGPTAAGSIFPSAGLGPQFRFPALYTAPWFTILPLPFDPQGRIPVPVVFPPMTVDVNIVVQFAVITLAPPDLSAPVNIFFDA